MFWPVSESRLFSVFLLHKLSSQTVKLESWLFERLIVSSLTCSNLLMNGKNRSLRSARLISFNEC